MLFARKMCKVCLACCFRYQKYGGNSLSSIYSTGSHGGTAPYTLKMLTVRTFR